MVTLKSGILSKHCMLARGIWENIHPSKNYSTRRQPSGIIFTRVNIFPYPEGKMQYLLYHAENPWKLNVWLAFIHIDSHQQFQHDTLFVHKIYKFPSQKWVWKWLQHHIDYDSESSLLKFQLLTILWPFLYRATLFPFLFRTQTAAVYL